MTGKDFRIGNFVSIDTLRKEVAEIIEIGNHNGWDYLRCKDNNMGKTTHNE